MKKIEFVCSIGFQGNKAIVDARMKRKLRDLKPESLLKAGLLRPAVCAALWDAQEDSQRFSEFATLFNAETGMALEAEGLKRLVGVYTIPDKQIQTLVV